MVELCGQCGKGLWMHIAKDCFEEPIPSSRGLMMMMIMQLYITRLTFFKLLYLAQVYDTDYNSVDSHTHTHNYISYITTKASHVKGKSIDQYINSQLLSF